MPDDPQVCHKKTASVSRVSLSRQRYLELKDDFFLKHTFVSSMLSSLSTRTSPGLIFICLEAKKFWIKILKKRWRIFNDIEHGLVRESYLREQNVESDFPMLPNGVNGGGSHVVAVGALDVGGEDQKMAAVHALQG